MSDEIYDHDDEDDEMVMFELPVPPSFAEIFQVMRFMIDADNREEVMKKEIRDSLDSFYDEYGDECTVPIISYVQQVMGWDLEILLDRSEVDNFLMKNYSLFDETIWQKVLKTRAINELHHEVFRISQTYLNDAVAEVLMKEQSHISEEGDPQE